MRNIANSVSLAPLFHRLRPYAFIIMLQLTALVTAEPSDKTVLFFGDSLTAGFDISKSSAYPAQLELLARHDGFPLRAINAGLSGDTTAGGLRRIEWFLKQPFDLAIIALGANDGLRALPPTEMEQNLSRIIDTIRERCPGKIVALAGMKLPPTYGEAYVSEFSAVFTKIAKEKDTPLYPFLLEGVAGDAALNLPDNLHPNEAGHKIIAQKLWEFLRPILQKSRSTT